ncbi:hypothetical protein R5W23_000556 [Gemmata sp. JC673]|uniref:Zinc ribbon domain-containing protein n=1 Tax=Gemmata algarum TaxID=2975278 RepID=A0ABU5EYL5_9BACT|nr:hypothetical protein [Gemmata algarum]MDY3559562.1 hypothetical protein [Gemmata algarum]
MPIRFRCGYCNRLLGIATRKAGTETTCPHCSAVVMVPEPIQRGGKTERLDLDDVDQLLGNVTERLTEPAAQVQVLEPPRVEPPRAAPAVPRAAKPAPVAPAAPAAEQPLFENDFEQLFGNSSASREDDESLPAVSDRAATSHRTGPRMIVLSPQQATLLTCAAVVLMALAFGAGFFVAR